MSANDQRRHALRDWQREVASARVRHRRKYKENFLSHYDFVSFGARDRKLAPSNVLFSAQLIFDAADDS
jgi:hypothetical protein